MQVLKKVLLGVILITVPCISAAANYPEPTGFINDFAGIIDPPARTQLANIITQFNNATGNEIAVVTIPSLDGEPIENYAVKLFEKWGIGKKNEDNGLLLLVAPSERQMRIEVGYGLEPYINDALAGRIIRETVVPHFAAGNFPLGVLNGVVEIISIISKRSGVEFDPAAAGSISNAELYHVKIDSAKKESFFGKIAKLIFLFFVILFFIRHPWLALLFFSNFGGGRSGFFRGGFGSSFGGSGGSFGGFSGGLSGGGGATGRW
ncbi:MAG: TPM domain-containing protein [Deltaproteobacteria bacterium]|nr:TPM domain-containing protein [Deltaproteobacteria bacterium]MBI2341748.1 TPM domain-containing protein [Deltaproteobacteria bacterium]